eukprot:gene9566-biopygen1593
MGPHWIPIGHHWIQASSEATIPIAFLCTWVCMRRVAGSAWAHMDPRCTPTWTPLDPGELTGAALAPIGPHWIQASSEAKIPYAFLCIWVCTRTVAGSAWGHVEPLDTSGSW